MTEVPLQLDTVCEKPKQNFEPKVKFSRRYFIVYFNGVFSRAFNRNFIFETEEVFLYKYVILWEWY